MEAAAHFRALDAARRTRILAVGGILLACFAGLIWYAGRTDWRTLYAGLDPGDARQMAQELTTAGIPFDVSPDGTALRVPAQNLDKARLVTTAKGGPHSGRMGFELFDKPNWMGSEFDEQVNYQRALEGELEHTIDTLSSVESSRVDLVLPHDSLFAADQREAKASVVLRLRQRTLSPDEALAIENLVAGAVDGLKPENVVLVDAQGGGLLGRPRGDAGLAAHEQEMAEKLVETLDPVAGIGNVRASVNVDYDPASTDETDESYDPAQTATLSSQRSQQTSGQPAASGIPGTASNTPNASTAGKPPLYPPATPNLQNMSQESDTYGVSKKVRHTILPAGRVRRMTAAVLINYRPVVQGKQTAWQPRTAAEMQQIVQLASAAIGIDTTRGDQISVEQIRFGDDGAPPAPSRMSRVLALVTESQVLLRYGTILLGMLVFVFLVARPALRSLASAPRPVAAAPALPGTAVQGPREIGPEQQASEKRRVRAQTVFEQVSDTVKRDPVQSTRLLESWIRTE